MIRHPEISRDSVLAELQDFAYGSRVQVGGVAESLGRVWGVGWLGDALCSSSSLETAFKLRRWGRFKVSTG